MSLAGATRVVGRRSWSILRPGLETGDYEALCRVGEGAFGEVWQVREVATGRLFAIKQLRAEWENHRTARRLLENEAEVGQRVRSPHLIRVVTSQLRASPPFLVLEWLEGETLDAALSRTPCLPCHRALWIARQCVSGLLALQAAQLIHGDLKPSNVFVGREGRVKLIDLGFTRRVGAASAELTGTPEYLAPEVLAGENSQHGRDIYSLGVMLYRMLTGRLPFQAETVPELMEQQQRATVTPIRTFAPLVPSEVAAFAERLLSKQPLRRSGGLADLLRELLALEVASLRTELGYQGGMLHDSHAGPPSA